MVWLFDHWLKNVENPVYPNCGEHCRRNCINFSFKSFLDFSQRRRVLFAILFLSRAAECADRKVSLYPTLCHFHSSLKGKKIAPPEISNSLRPDFVRALSFINQDLHFIHSSSITILEPRFVGIKHRLRKVPRFNKHRYLPASKSQPYIK